MSVARSRRCCVHDATDFTTQRRLNKPQEQTNGYARKSRLHRKGGVRDRGRERHRPRGGAGVRSRGCQRGGRRRVGTGQPGNGPMIEEQGGRALAVRCDVTRGEDVRAALDKTVEAFGRLDVAFNNAGVEPKKMVPTAEVEEEEWDRIINIDLRGVFLCMKYEIPLMLEHGGGAIVNTSSGAGIIGIKGNPAYTAAKHGVIGLTRAAALDYAPSNVRVNAVCPGYIDTPMMARFTGGTAEGRARVISEEPIGRMGKPEEIAAAVVWLCSDPAAFVIGHAMVIDGGQTV